MRDSLAMLRESLCILADSCREEMVRVRSVKGRNDRVDALTCLVGGIYSDGGLRYLDGRLMFFDGMCYVPLSEKDLLVMTRSVLMDRGVSPTDLRAMGTMPLDSLAVKSGLSSSSLLCFDNCVLDVASGRTHRFSPDLFVTERLPYRYDRDARCEEWLSFLEWAIPDRGERMALQEFVGLCYVDRSVLSVEKFAVLVGSGANGKSVFTRVVSSVMGEGSVSTLDPSQLCSEKMVPYLNGKRLNCSPDVRASASFDSALKALASGQTITGRRIYGEAEQVKCPPILFALNEMPVFRDTSDGFFRRLMLFGFDSHVRYEDQDRQLASRIIARESSGVMNWILTGRKRLLDRGGEFTPSHKMDMALESVRNGASRSSFLRDWMDDNGYSPVRADGLGMVRVSANRIIDGLHGLMSKSAVTRELERMGVECRRCGDGMHYCLYEKIS